MNSTVEEWVAKAEGDFLTARRESGAAPEQMGGRIMLTRKRGIQVVVVLLALTAVAGAQTKPPEKPGEKIAFAHMYPPGKYLVTVASVAETDTEAGSTRSRERQSLEITAAINVRDPDAEGSREVHLDFRRIVCKKTTNGAESTLYSSDTTVSTYDSMPALLWGVLYKTHIVAKIGSDGEWKGAVGLKEAYDLATKEHPSLARQTAPFIAMIEPGLISAQIVAPASRLPTKPLAPGEVWTTAMPLTLPGGSTVGMEVLSTFRTLDGSTQTAVLEEHGEAMISDRLTFPAGDLTLTIHHTDYTYDNKVQYSVRRGCLVAQNIATRLVMEGLAKRPDGSGSMVRNITRANITVNVTPEALPD